MQLKRQGLEIVQNVTIRRPTNRHSPSTTAPLSNRPLPAALAGVQRGMFALFVFLNLHSESLCGSLYPLPRCSTFRFRNVLHLVEPRNRVAHVRGVLQRLLALLGKGELGCRYPIATWLGQLCHSFLPREHPLPHGRPRNSWPRRLRQLFQFLQRGVVDSHILLARIQPRAAHPFPF
jgi:hypothetical protein